MSDDRVWNRFVWNKGDVQILRRSADRWREGEAIVQRRAALRAERALAQRLREAAARTRRNIHPEDPDRDFMLEMADYLESLIPVRTSLVEAADADDSEDAQIVEAADPDELMDEIDRILESLVRGGE